MLRVKTFTSELKIFKTIKELNDLDDQINSFVKKNKIKKIVSVGDACTTDNGGATIGVIRVLTYEEPERKRRPARAKGR